MNISPNTSALMALNELRKNSDRTQKIMNKAALGEKIASAGDDASNYAISEKMRANIRALNQDIVNASTGNRLIATAESGIHEIVNNLRAIKELAINAANDTNTDADRAIMQKNVDQRLAQIDDIAATTNYNGKYLLNGDYRRLIFESGETSTVGSDGTTPSPAPETGDGTAPLTTTVGTPPVTIRLNTVTGLLDGFTGVAKSTTPSKYPMLYHGIETDLVYDRMTSDRLTDLEWKVDFSKTKKSDGSYVTDSDYPSAFDKQGFSFGCNGCAMFVNVIFDASLEVSNSNVNYTLEKSSGYGRSMYNYQYVIGIKGVTSEKELEKAFYEGTLKANEKPDPPGAEYHDPTNDLTYTDPVTKEPFFGEKWVTTHYVRLSYDYDSEELLLKSNFGPMFPIYDKGTIVSKDMPIPGEDVVGDRWVCGNPLVIHTGTKSSQNLHVFIEDMSTKAMGIDKLKITTQEQAKNLLSSLESRERPDGIIDRAIEYALGECTHLGAYYQELEFTQSNLTIQSENTTNAESVIRDADMGETMMEYTRLNILTQASQAMLGQANQNVGSKLDLLQ